MQGMGVSEFAFARSGGLLDDNDLHDGLPLALEKPRKIEPGRQNVGLGEPKHVLAGAQGSGSPLGYSAA